MLPIYDGAAVSDDSQGNDPRETGDHPLKGKRIYIPPMAYGSARAFASAFRAIGLEAEPTPPSDNRTRELGSRYTSGDECYPAKVTVGDFMKVVENPAIDKKRIALFMPTAQGPCRFGQYAPTPRSRRWGVSRTTAESTWGGGRKLPGLTSNSSRVSANSAVCKVRYPYSRWQGLAMRRSATSF